MFKMELKKTRIMREPVHLVQYIDLWILRLTEFLDVPKFSVVGVEKIFFQSSELVKNIF